MNGKTMTGLIRVRCGTGNQDKGKDSYEWVTGEIR